MTPSRRHFLRSAAASSILFPGIMNQLLADDGDPLAIREPHFAPKAKNVIFLFMTGGVSHVDTFDPKPELTRQHGKQIASDHPAAKNRDDYKRIYLKRPQWEFQPYGQSGTEVSSLFPHVGECVDDIALIRSMYTSHVDHYFATLGMHTGSFSIARPSMGSWVTYGLGSMNRNLPGFVVIAPAQTYAGTQVYSNDVCPVHTRGRWLSPATNRW